MSINLFLPGARATQPLSPPDLRQILYGAWYWSTKRLACTRIIYLILSNPRISPSLKNWTHNSHPPWMSLACWIVTYMPSLRLDFSVMDTVYTIPPRIRHLSIFRRELSTEILLLIMGQQILVILRCWIYRSNHVIDFEWTISSLYWDAYSVLLTPCIPGWRRITGSGISFLFGFSVTLLGTAVLPPNSYCGVTTMQLHLGEITL